MSVSRDIVATYRGPGRVMRQLLAAGEHEGRVLAFLMGGCVLLFVAQWPLLAREAYRTGQEIEPLLGGALLSIVLFLPLIFYAIAFVSALLLRLFGWAGTAFSARLALFWAFLAAMPLALLRGLVAGFIGPGAGLTMVELAWVAVFLWFWIVSLRVAGEKS